MIITKKKHVENTNAYLHSPLIYSLQKSTHTLFIDANNGIPGINICFAKSDDNEILLLYHIDAYAAMSTCIILLHLCIIAQYPHLVA